MQFRLRLTHLAGHDRETLAAFSKPELDLEVKEFFPDEDYLRELQSADVLLLPYSPIEYRIKNSNIVSEALACGTPVIVPGESNSLLHFVKPLNAACYIAMPAYTGTGLLFAMQSCVDNLPVLQLAALSEAPSVGASRSPARFINQLNGEAATHPPRS